MNGRRATIGFALLCALMFSTLVAQSAIAQVGTKSTNTTAVTCVDVGANKGAFEDAHCDVKVGPEKGKYEHEFIAKDTTTELEVSNAKTKNNTTEHTTAQLDAVIAGVVTKITCTKAKSVPEKSFIHNVETEGKHTVTGTVQVTLSECTVDKPLKCIVTDIVLTAEFVGVEGLKPGGNDMGLEFVGEGPEKTLAEITFHNKEPEKCPFGTNTFRLKGSAIATSNVAQGNKHSGATWVFEDANEMETLEIGLKKASLATTLTPSMAGGGNPIALTTAT